MVIRDVLEYAIREAVSAFGVSSLRASRGGWREELSKVLAAKWPSPKDFGSDAWAGEAGVLVAGLCLVGLLLADEGLSADAVASELLQRGYPAGVGAGVSSLVAVAVDAVKTGARGGLTVYDAGIPVSKCVN